jgi:hypothetical protein
MFHLFIAWWRKLRAEAFLQNISAQWQGLRWYWNKNVAVVEAEAAVIGSNTQKGRYGSNGVLQPETHQL